MKKLIYLTVLLLLMININACSGYKPIFKSSNLKFEITDYSLEGDKKLAKRIYSKLYNLSKVNKNNDNIRNVYIKINTKQEKDSTVKSTAGKILAYNINLNTHLIVKDFLSDKIILEKKIFISSSYKVEDQYFETIKSEKKVIDNLIDKTYQDLLIQLTEKLSQ